MMSSLRLHLIAAAACAAVLACAHPAAADAPGDQFSNHAFLTHVSDGLLAFYSKNFAASKAAFEDALAIAPTDSFSLSFYNASLRNLGVEALTQQADQEEEDAAKNPRDALAQTRLGFTYLFMSQFQTARGPDARDAFNQALQLDPHMAAAHVGLGIYRLGDNSTSRAKAEFLAALQTVPKDVLAREYLSSIYQVDLKDPNRALAYLVDVPNMMPNYPDAFYHLGSIMDDLGQYDAAIKYLKTAIDLDKGHVGEAGQYGLPLLGTVYLKVHKVPEAKLAFSEAIVYGEAPEFSQSQLDKIKHGDVK
ncbi:MAG: tetratricopeptide repeat protein [Candidatus Eremiobacteraeota bacterium]|nr:tetratricopeptide repeat protein [Candidatus Eremiobacteraeota bacterium]MBV8223085.1 tetratricopeptide repeat protein [Candidatus Eremiobacteraeota bacterium]